MPPRKKIRRKLNDTNSQEHIPNDENIWLAKLPNELLMKIFNLISPIDALNVKSLEEERFNELWCSKRADFSQCCCTGLQDFTAYFKNFSPNHITEINFNFLFYMKPTMLVRCITKCKELLRLSIIECGLDHTNINQIFRGCKKLESLQWTGKGPNFPNVLHPTFSNRLPVIECDNLRKLFIQVAPPDDDNFDQNFPISLLSTRLEEIYVDFTSLCSPPFIIAHEDHNIFSIKFSEVHTAIFLSDERVHDYTNLHIMKAICITALLLPTLYGLDKDLRAEIQKMDFSSDEFVSSYIHHKSHLQFECTGPNLMKLSSIPPNSISSLTIIFKEAAFLFSSELVENLISATGLKLKNLCLKFVRKESEAMRTIKFEAPLDDFIMMMDISQKIFNSCLNLTSLNMFGLHFNLPLPYKALSQLKGLRSLTIPDCAVFFCPCPGVSCDKHYGMQQLVENTPNMMHFSLRGCVHIVHGCNCGDMPFTNSTAIDPNAERLNADSELSVMRNWPKLKHLTLKSLRYFRAFNFLHAVANSCPNFETLEMIEVGHEKVCHYVPSVVYLIRQAKNLKFLRLNQRAFPTARTPFWKAISEASNLEGLCLYTSCSSVLQTCMVVPAINNLKKLHLFHFRARRFPDNLQSSIKKSMRANKVENPRIEVIKIPYVRRAAESESVVCARRHFMYPFV